MLFDDVAKLQRYFEANLEDWLLGGPKKKGWTREGPPIVLNKKFNIKFSKIDFVDIEEGLAKNKKEVEKWHISFLRNHTDFENTQYFQEYLAPRYTTTGCHDKIKEFLSLFEIIKSKGFDNQNPILVADIASLNLGFPFFRFDGCHRLACCKILDIKKVKFKIFKLFEI